MRISVRSHVRPGSLSQASRFSRASNPDPNGAETAPLSPGGYLFAGRTGLRGRTLIVPGCGEERFPFRGVLGVTREEYRVTPVAVDMWRGNINPLPFRPRVCPQDPPAGPPPAKGAGPEVAAKPVKILTGCSGPADPGAYAVAQETYSTSNPKGIAWVIATSTKICSAGGSRLALARLSKHPQGALLLRSLWCGLGFPGVV